MPDDRIARVMGVTVEAVRSSRFRAIRALREAFEA